MKENILLIFPTKKQLNYFRRYYSECVYYVVSHDKIENDEIFIYILDNDNFNIPDNVKVFCCHEEGIYWLKCNIKKSWELQFSFKLFSVILKDDFKKYLSSIGIKNSLFWYNKNQITQYPVVIKPIIGFGSIGVKIINNEMELGRVVHNENLKSLLTSITPYKNKYFLREKNGFIFEQYISGDFFRVPFVLKDGNVKYIFPIKGNETTYRNNSDFHWTEFELGPISKLVYDSMKDLLTKLTRELKMTAGVFIAEFLVDEQDDVFLLEMSPRQPSSRICKMIEYYSGIDLELLAIDLFFSIDNIPLSLCENKRNIIMRIFRGEIKIHKDCELLQKADEVSVYGDRITTVYCERREE